MQSERTVTPEDAARRIGQVLADVFASIAIVRESYTALWTPGARRPTSKDLSAILPTLFGQLELYKGFIQGTGVAVARDVLADTSHWIEWWTRNAEGNLHRLAFDLHHESLDFYDYMVADWFTAPQRGLSHSVVGPYIDYSGTDEYVVTLTMPAIVDGVFAGVVGADVQIAELERRIRPLERLVSQPVAVVNASGRVVVSTSPTQWVGSLLTEMEAGGSGKWAATGSITRYECPGTPWSLVLVN